MLEHIRIALEEIARFSHAVEEAYVPLKWPEDYWPDSPAPADRAAWDRSVEAVRAALGAMARCVGDPKRDLFEPFPWGEGQTLLREALLAADHNAYHVGQLMLVRRMIETL